MQEERTKLTKLHENIFPQQNRRDYPHWLWSRKGTYTMALRYKIITYKGIRDDIAEIIWKIRAPNKVQAFFWLTA